MDNESFLNYTCGQQFAQNGPSQEFPQDDPSQEFAQDDIMGDERDGEGFVGEGDGEGFLGEAYGEGDGEGFLGEAYGEGFVNDPTPRRASRGANFTKKEDETLCHAWIFIGVDPITGNEQQSNTYWERIHEYYRQHSKKARTIISLQHRWSTINSECFKWSNCLAQLDRLNPSGTSPVDKINITQKLFMGKPKKKGGKPGKAFTLFHCFTILEKEEKWKNRPSNEIPNKRKTPTTTVGEDLVVDTDDEGSSSPTPLSSVNRKRPVEGRKKAKEARAKGGENMYKDSLDNMMAVRKELANERREMRHKEIEERKLFEERKVATEERRAAAEEKRLELEERKVMV